MGQVSVCSIDLIINNDWKERKKVSLNKFSMETFDERLSEIEAKSYQYEFRLYNKEGIEISKGDDVSLKENHLI